MTLVHLLLQLETRSTFCWVNPHMEIEEKDFTFIAVEGDWPAGE